MMRLYRCVLVIALAVAECCAFAQVDRRDVRRGNRDFRKENYKEAEIDYRKALVKDSLSFAANYNLANTLYRQQDYANAAASLEKIKEVVPESEHSADYYYNLGDVALASKDYKTAVQAFMTSLLLRPDDLDAKENFIYARKMLENQQQNGGGQGQDDKNNDNSQNNDRNDDQNGDQNKDNQDNQQQNEQDGGDQDQNQNDGSQDNSSPENHDDGQGISPQAAQQMLQAIQAKEKETQDKVNKEKAALLQSRQREKNW